MTCCILQPRSLARLASAKGLAFCRRLLHQEVERGVASTIGTPNRNSAQPELCLPDV